MKTNKTFFHLLLHTSSGTIHPSVFFNLIFFSNIRNSIHTPSNVSQRISSFLDCMTFFYPQNVRAYDLFACMCLILLNATVSWQIAFVFPIGFCYYIDSCICICSTLTLFIQASAPSWLVVCMWTRNGKGIYVMNPFLFLIQRKLRIESSKRLLFFSYFV